MEQNIFKVMGDLIKVDFEPGYFPVDNDILATFFPDREVYVSEDRERWTGVVCSMQEWEQFMQFAEHAVRVDPNLAGNESALEIIRHFESDYQAFQRALVTGSFKTPMDWMRLVA